MSVVNAADDAAAVEIALERVLSSRTFSRARRLRRFLSHVVLETLEGNGARLKEYSVGIAAFDRTADFDPRIDTIVRVEAIKLRERLLAYYRTEGATDPICISIPKGSYRPAFAAQQVRPHPIFEDPEALYWQAKALISRYTPEAHERARSLLIAGTERWPESAPLHGALAQAYAGPTCGDLADLAPHENVPKMQAAARRALELDAGWGEAHLYLRLAELGRPDISGLMSAVGTALALSPRDPDLHHWAAAILVSAGKTDEALLHMRQALRLNPAGMIHRTHTAVWLFAGHRVDEALGHLTDVLAIEPSDYSANFWLSRALCVAGRFDEARALAGRAYAASSSPRALSMLGYAEGRAGNLQAADAIVAKLRGLAHERYVAHSAIAAVHVGAGRYQDGVTELKKAACDHDYILAWGKLDSRWEPIRDRIPALRA